MPFLVFHFMISKHSQLAYFLFASLCLVSTVSLSSEAGPSTIGQKRSAVEGVSCVKKAKTNDDAILQDLVSANRMATLFECGEKPISAGDCSEKALGQFIKMVETRTALDGYRFPEVEPSHCLDMSQYKEVVARHVKRVKMCGTGLASERVLKPIETLFRGNQYINAFLA